MMESLCTVCSRSMPSGHSVCQNCREFYIRSINQSYRWKCIKKGICEFYHQSPFYCRSCRYDRCAAANIKIPPKHMRRGYTCVPYFGPADIQMKMEEMSLSLYPRGIQMLKRINGVRTSIEFANRMLEFEKNCNNLTAPSPSEFDANLDVSLGDVLFNPECCSSRRTAGWDQWHTSNLKGDVQYQMKNSYARLATLFADFSSAVPEMRQLHINDQLKVTQQNFMTFTTLAKAYNAWKEKIPMEETLRRATRYNINEYSTKTYHNTITAVEKVNKINIKQVFEDLAIRDEEIVILKIICIFCSPFDLSYEGARITSIARDRYTVILSDYLRTCYPGKSEEEIYKRLRTLLRVVTDVKILSEKAQSLFEALISRNIGGLQGSLTYDLHMRKF